MIQSNPITEELNKLIQENNFFNKEIILFGANKSSKQMKEYLEEKGYLINAIIDNDKRKWQQAPFGIMTYKPEEYLLPLKDNRVILIVSQYYAEMTAQMEAMGYVLNRHIFIVQKLFRQYDTSIEALQSFENKVLEGEILYKSIREQYGEVPVFICPYTGNGDIYIIGLYLEEFLKIKDIGDYVVTVVGRACSKIGTMFSWQKIIILSQEESDSLLAYIRLAGLQICNTYVLNDCFHQVVNRRFRGYKNTDFRKMFQKVVFGLRDNYRCDAKTDYLTKSYIEKVGMIPGKAVILSPYANTIGNPSMNLWEKLAHELSSKGYQIYTNCSGEEETAVLFSTPLSDVPFSMMKSIVEYAGNFIGIRSGLCDIISGAVAKKIILYPEGMLFGSCSTLDYFSLNKMGLCDDAVEIEFGNIDYAILLEKIMKQF